MGNDIDLTDDQAERVLQVLESFGDKSAWGEALTLLDLELRSFLERGFSPMDSCKLAIVKSWGGLQTYVPRIKSFLVRPGLIQSRSKDFGRGRAPAPSAAYQRQIADLRELTDIGAKITAKQHSLDELKKQVREQREILRKLKILVPKELEQDATP